MAQAYVVSMRFTYEGDTSYDDAFDLRFPRSLERRWTRVVFACPADNEDNQDKLKQALDEMIWAECRGHMAQDIAGVNEDDWECVTVRGSDWKPGSPLHPNSAVVGVALRPEEGEEEPPREWNFPRGLARPATMILETTWTLETIRDLPVPERAKETRGREQR